MTRLARSAARCSRRVPRQVRRRHRRQRRSRCRGRRARPLAGWPLRAGPTHSAPRRAAITSIRRSPAPARRSSSCRRSRSRRRSAATCSPPAATRSMPRSRRRSRSRSCIRARGNLGGGGFAVVRTQGRGARARLPRDRAGGGDARHVRRSAGKRRVAARRLARGVPGIVAGLWELHTEDGKMTWKQVVAPAIALATRRLRGRADPARVARARGCKRGADHAAALWSDGKPRDRRDRQEPRARGGARSGSPSKGPTASTRARRRRRSPPR